MSRVMSSPSAIFVLIMLLSLDLFECRPDEGSYVATSDVLQLEDEESLMAAVARNKLIFVLFQVPLDHFCRAQIGLFHSLANEMADKEVKFAFYDTSSTSKETLQKLGVTGAPCYKLFQGHSEVPLHYNGEIDFSGMQAYLKHQAAMSSSRISRIEEWEALVRSSKYTVVGFLDPERAAAERDAFLEVVSSSGKIYSIGVVDAAPRKWLGSEAIPSWLGIDCTLDDASWAIVAYHTRDVGMLPEAQTEMRYQKRGDKLGQKEIMHFIVSRKLPFVFETSLQEALDLASVQGNVLLLFLHTGDGDFWRISDEVEKVSSKVRGALTAVSIDVTRDAEAKKLLEDQKVGGFAIILKDGERQKLMRPQYTASSIETWIRSDSEIQKRLLKRVWN